MQVVVLRLEEFFCEFRDDVRIVVLAREDVQVDRVGLIGEVPGNERRFDELRHGVSRDAIVFAEVDDDGLTKALHADALAQFYNELLNLLCRPDGLRIAPVEVNPRV